MLTDKMKEKRNKLMAAFDAVQICYDRMIQYQSELRHAKSKAEAAELDYIDAKAKWAKAAAEYSPLPEGEQANVS